MDSLKNDIAGLPKKSMEFEQVALPVIRTKSLQFSAGFAKIFQSQGKWFHWIDQYKPYLKAGIMGISS